MPNRRTLERINAQRMVVRGQSDAVISKENLMSDFRDDLALMRRPGLLMRAVRCGLADYRRHRDLRRLTPGDMTPERTVPRLIEAEAELESTRLRGDATYSIADHIEVLIALTAEVRLLRHPDPV